MAVLVTLTGWFSIPAAAAPSILLEAEEGTLSGTCYVENIAEGYSGTGYVAGLTNQGASVTVTAQIEKAGTYRLGIRHRSPYSAKQQFVDVNELRLGSYSFPLTSSFITTHMDTLFLEAGANSFRVEADWGWTYIDYFLLTRDPYEYAVTNHLRNANADTRTVSLYRYLQRQFGRVVLSGQDISHQYVTGDSGDSEDMLTYLPALTLRMPVVISLDLQNYSPNNPWNHGEPFDDGTVDAVIDWYEASQSNGIVSLQWHWFSPLYGGHECSTFYASNTTFDVELAVLPDTEEYTATLRDIDAIAAELGRLQAVGLPVLWRPLHEAGHGGFWWGAAGPAAAHALYDLLYDRLTGHHGLNNLIWVWATPEAEWYPGNEKVDVFGYDFYADESDLFATAKMVFERMRDISGGERLLALTENGRMPDIGRLFTENCVWAYFCTWNDWLISQNSTQHIQEVYSHEQVVTLAVPGVTVTTNGSVPYYWLKARNPQWTNNYEQAAMTDHDQDGYTTAEEYWTGTDPLDENSRLIISSMEQAEDVLRLAWVNRYVDRAISPLAIQCATNLLADWTTIAHVHLRDGTNTWEGSTADGTMPFFFRLAVTNMRHQTY